MDIAKLKKILSVIAVIAIVIIVIYNSGILGGNGENDGSSDYPAGTSQISDNSGLSNQGSSQQNGTGLETDTSHQNGTGLEADTSHQNGTGSEADTSNQNGNGSDTDATATTGTGTGNGADADTAGQGSAELPADTDASTQYTEYFFRSNKLLTQHYEKHGIEMGFDSKESYEKAASDVINNPAALHKLEAEDGDFVYYLEDTNEFVILSQDGYIRTYFLPSAGKAYYERQ